MKLRIANKICKVAANRGMDEPLRHSENQLQTAVNRTGRTPSCRRADKLWNEIAGLLRMEKFIAKCIGEAKQEYVP